MAFDVKYVSYSLPQFSKYPTSFCNVTPFLDHVFISA